MITLAQFGTGQVLLSMLYFFLFFIWIWLLISIFGDIFSSYDMSGWGKAAWSIFVIIAPFLGVFVYLIARGGKMQEHAVKRAQAADIATRAYINEAVQSPPDPAQQIASLNELRKEGVIDEEEFRALKAKLAI
jgi:hypothetical protein